MLAKIPFRTLDRAVRPFGYEVIQNHFYSPMPLTSDLTSKFLTEPSLMAGVEMPFEAPLKIAANEFAPYLQEFRERFPLHKDKVKNRFWLINGGYMAVDAHIYWSMIRHFKPKRIIEIGCGHSTLMAGQACELNKIETGETTELVGVEPYPGGIFDEGVPGMTELIRLKVQDADPKLWQTLEAGDILFIDSSHVLASGNDVHYEYLHILPNLKPGVFVHIHDISLPKPYPKVYSQMKLYWNEQYLLHAFLIFNSRFEVFWPGNFLLEKSKEKMLELFPEICEMRKIFPASEPSAFWIRSKSAKSEPSTSLDSKSSNVRSVPNSGSFDFQQNPERVH